MEQTFEQYVLDWWRKYVEYHQDDQKTPDGVVYWRGRNY